MQYVDYRHYAHRFLSLIIWFRNSLQTQEYGGNGYVTCRGAEHKQKSSDWRNIYRGWLEKRAFGINKSRRVNRAGFLLYKEGSAGFLHQRQIEGFAQGPDERLILTNGFAGAVGELGHRFAFALDQFDHDIQRLDAGNIAGQARADAESEVDALIEVAVERQRLSRSVLSENTSVLLIGSMPSFS